MLRINLVVFFLFCYINTHMSDIPMFVAQTILTPKFSVKLQFCGVLNLFFLGESLVFSAFSFR